jgi:threonine/homoserine/homoserine lactone efflux protein
MEYLTSILALAGIHLLAVASPGPAFVATVRLSVQHSRRNGLLHSLGLGLAAATWAVGAMIGLQALMLQVGWLYRVLQLGGGIYLLYIGVMSWRHAKDDLVLDNDGSNAISGFEAFRRGFATNIANPKVMVFFASIFAALLKPEWPLWVRLCVIAIVAVDESGWFALLAMLLSTRRSQIVYRRAKATIDRVAGSFMMLFGGKLIWNAGS